MTFTGTAGFANETTLMNTPTGAQANRRVFLSRPLTKDVRLSGTRRSIDLVASRPGARRSNFGALLVDYGARHAGHPQRRGHLEHDHPHLLGRYGNDALTGAAGPACTHRRRLHRVAPARSTHACYLEVTKPTQNVTQWRVTRGTLDSSNRNSLWYPTRRRSRSNRRPRIKFPTMRPSTSSRPATRSAS